MNDDYIVENILKYTQSWADYKSFCLVSHTWHRIMLRIFGNGDYFVKHLDKLLKLFPNENWDWYKVVSMKGFIPKDHPELVEHIIRRIGKGDYYAYLSKNPNITINDITSSEHRLWSRTMFSFNPNMTWDVATGDTGMAIFGDSHSPREDKFWYSMNPNVTWDCVESEHTARWDYGMLAAHPNITWDIVISNPEFNGVRHIFSANPNVTWDIVRSNAEDWDYKELSKHIPWDIIKANPELPWSPAEVSKNASVTWDVIQANPGYPWTAEVSQNPNITWDIVEANPKYPWNYECMSLNPNITWRNVRDTYDRGWSFHMLSGNSFKK
jgi:hypothetical protein